MPILCLGLALLRKSKTYGAVCPCVAICGPPHHGAGLLIFPTGSHSWAAKRSVGWSWYHQ